MKRSFNVNMGGTTFSFDEDALELLEQYIARVKEYYKNKGEELKVAEIEETVSNKISSRVSAGGIVTIEIIKVVLDEVGLPFGAAECMSGATAKSTNASSSENNGSGASDAASAGNETWRAAMMLGKKLYCDPNDKYLGGVLSGIAKYCGWSVSSTRIIFLLLFLFGCAGGALSTLLLLSYIVMWIILPEASTILDVTRMRKPQPVGHSAADVEAAWKRNYDMALAELTYPKNKGCLGAVIKILFFFLLFIIAVPLLFSLAVVIFVLGVVFFALIEAFGVAVIGNIYILLLLLLPLFALIHWILKKCGVCEPLNIYIKIAIVVCWLFTIVFAGYKLCSIVEDNGGWEKVRTSMVDGTLFDKDFWEDVVEKALESAEVVQYAAWDDENENLPFVIDIKQKSNNNNVSVKFYGRDYWRDNIKDSYMQDYDVTKLDINLADDKEGAVRFVWNPETEEILVGLDATLGESMSLVSNGHNIRYINKNDSITYSNATEKGCIPFEIRYFERKTPQLYMFGNDTVAGVFIEPIAARYSIKNNGSLRINGVNIVGGDASYEFWPDSVECADSTEYKNF